MSAEAPPGFAQHVYQCSFAGLHPIERVALQALHKESAQEGIFVPDGLLQALRRCTKNRLCTKITKSAQKLRTATIRRAGKDSYG